MIRQIEATVTRPHLNALLQTADGLIELSSHEEAGSGRSADRGPFPPVTLAPLAGEAVHGVRVVIRQIPDGRLTHRSKTVSLY